MAPLLRKEFQDFVKACEHLIATHGGSELSIDEQDIVTFYLQDLPARLKVP